LTALIIIIIIIIIITVRMELIHMLKTVSTCRLSSSLTLYGKELSIKGVLIVNALALYTKTTIIERSGVEIARVSNPTQHITDNFRDEPLPEIDCTASENEN